MTSSDTTVLEQASAGLAGAVERAAAYTVRVSARRRIAATGVAWGDGLVVTADHVIEHEDDMKVGLPDDAEVAAALVGRNPGWISRCCGWRPAAPRLHHSRPTGRCAWGTSHSRSGGPSRGGVEASIGVVSAVGGPWRSRGGGEVEGFLRTDTTFFPGFSGGPLVGGAGRVIGLNTSRFRPGPGITIPGPAVRRIVEALATQGRIRRAYLGIGSRGTRLPSALAAKVGGQERGLLIVGVEEESPAGRGGLLIGDIVIGVDGAALGLDPLVARLRSLPAGRATRLHVLRGR
ncbi:MAG: serine protease, partial [Chloroflexi bacterium]|nr:serine protease [Chloroflexota bacterium]